MVIVEVLSDGREETSRGEKLEGDRRIPTLTDYLMVSQDEVRVEYWHRKKGWRLGLTIHRGAEATVPPSWIEAELGLGTGYGVLGGDEDYLLFAGDGLFRRSIMRRVRSWRLYVCSRSRIF